MDRFAIFVDAGYLYAAAGLLCCNTIDRSKFRLDFRKTHSGLVEIAKRKSNLEYLRTYWYDAALYASPTPAHIALASIPGIKLRLGRLTQQGQKGVDSRIVHDLIVLARDRAIASAYVLSGDEDIREGVTAAQDCGVSVALIGIAPVPGEQNQARSLIHEADDLLLLSKDDVAPWVESIATESRSAPESISPASGEAEEIGRRFAETWAEANTTRIDDVKGQYPRIPRDIDQDLRRYATEQAGTTLADPQMRLVRRGFWSALEEPV